jgi:hypothetical protein
MPLGESTMRFDNYYNHHEIDHSQNNSKIVTETANQKDCKMTNEEQLI